MSLDLYVVDGSSYIFRAYHATPPLTNRFGFPTNALYAFTRMILKLLEDILSNTPVGESRYLAIIFDTGKPNFRHSLFPNYKANRSACPEDLKLQMPLFRKIVEALGIVCLEKDGYEADDIIATIVAKLKTRYPCDDMTNSCIAPKVNKLIVVSGDKDLMQLVDDRVVVWDVMRNVYYDYQAVMDKFGVPPEGIADLLSIMGDSSDNIPGAEGIGKKTAQSLLQHAGSLQKLMDDPSLIEKVTGIRGASSVRKKFESSLERLQLSRKLVSLCNDVELEQKYLNLETYEYKTYDDSQIEALFTELDFGNLLKSLAVQVSGYDYVNLYSTKNFVKISPDKLSSFVCELATKSSFAFDIETTSLNVLDCGLVGISFCWAKDEAYYIPILQQSFGGTDLDMSYCDVDIVCKTLRPIFENDNIKKVGFNLKFDVGVLETYDIRVKGVEFDSMLASYVLSPDKRVHSLSELTKEYLHEDMQTYKDLVGDRGGIHLVPLNETVNYACHDAEASWNLYLVLLNKLRQLDENDRVRGNTPYNVFKNIEMPLIPVISSMERKGILVDVSFLHDLGVSFASSLSQLENEIYFSADTVFNLNSPKQLSEVLFEKLGLSTKGMKKTKIGYSTDAAVLTRLKDKHEVVEKILDYRELHKLKTTYIEGLLKLVNPKTNRVHTSFNQSVTATGRLSSSEPNLQNIPIRTERGKQLRRAFIARSGYKLLSVDYSQIELRVLAHLSEDPSLIDAFIADADIHELTARELFSDRIASDIGHFPDELRRIAKTVNFGVVYGISAFRLAEQLNVARWQAQAFIDSYFARYPRVSAYFENLKLQLDECGYVSTMHGRRRFVTEIDKGGRDAGYVIRSLMNFPIQGTAAEIIKLAMIAIHNKINNSPMYADSIAILLQVHDELIFEVEEHCMDEMRAFIRREMEGAINLHVPLRVDMKACSTWEH